MTTSNAIRIVPENSFGQLNGQTVFSHGIEFGIAQAGTRDLREATITWLKAVAQNNPELRLAGEQQALKISQRSAIGTLLVNRRRSEARSRSASLPPSWRTERSSIT